MPSRAIPAGLYSRFCGEFAIVVADCCQKMGLGTELLRRVIDIARAEGLDCVGADVRPDNTGALRTAEKAGFTVSPKAGTDVRRAEYWIRC